MNTPFSLDIESLPTLPVIAAQIIACVNNPNTSVQDVAEVIVKDQAMSTKILKLVNSAFYGFPKRIGTVSHAISILGFETVRGLVLGLSILDLFKVNEFDLVNFWRHSIRTASLNAFIAKKWAYPRYDEAFTIGLIHDVGKLLFMLKMPDTYHRILETDSDEMPLFQREKQAFGVDHAEAGAAMVQSWNFPDFYVQAIREHHQVPVMHPGPFSAVHMLYLSNCLDGWVQEKPSPTPEDVQRLLHFQIELQEVVDYMNAIHDEVNDFLKLFAK